MKKLIAMIVVLCGVVMADVIGSDNAIKQIPLTNGQHDYINFVTKYTQGTSFLKYTVTDSQQLIAGYRMSGKPYYANDEHNIGHVYFTNTATQADVDAYNTEHGTNLTKAVVQFAGTYMDSGKQSLVTDYGIYLYNPTTGNRISDYYSVTTGNTGTENVFELESGATFGVYYVNKNGDIITTTDNWIGNYDKGQDHGKNPIKNYDDEHPDGYYTTTYKKFMCLLNGNDNAFGQEKTHWEFMLQTMLDNPYYNVDVDDFQGNGDTFQEEPTTSGQPLPGTMATLVISGLCAISLKKKNRK